MVMEERTIETKSLGLVQHTQAVSQAGRGTHTIEWKMFYLLFLSSLSIAIAMALLLLLLTWAKAAAERWREETDLDSSSPLALVKRWLKHNNTTTTD